MTAAEQEYLKQIYLGTIDQGRALQTRELAALVDTRPSSVTDMVRRLNDKGLLSYQKNKGFHLSALGAEAALQVIRRHRLWELFLTEKLGIDWKEVHHMATQLQSIISEPMINGLEAFLQYPLYDPHGEPIPGADGSLPNEELTVIYDLKFNTPAVIKGYQNSSIDFLIYMEKLKLLIGSTVVLLSVVSYDGSIELTVDGGEPFLIPKEIAQKIFVRV